MIKKKILVLLFSLTLLVFEVGFVQAVGPCEPCGSALTPPVSCDSGLTCEGGKCRGCPTTGGVTICNPLQACDIEELIDKIIDFILWVAIAIAPIMLLYAGFLFVTAGGDSQKITQAKTIITYTVIGLAVVLLAKGLISVLESILGG